MKLYCGIDLHSNNHYVSIIDQQDKRLKEKRLSNDLTKTIAWLEPYRKDLHLYDPPCQERKPIQ